ncbi:MAG: Uma2 family endonuclease [Planctomycetia bacterium]|nr:Uma2 family endonuclease [Planctomycetia bacterium]
MAILSSPPPSFTLFTAFRRFTVDEYHRMMDTGILNDEDKVELLEGYVVEKMPRNPPHDVVIQRLNKRLTRLNLVGWEVRVRSAITLPDSEPEPDLTVARGDDHTFANRHPGPPELGTLIEVADTTLARDRHDKGRIYARSQVAVYWIVNLVESQIEVYTNPSGSGAAAAYGTRTDFRAGDSVPLVLDGLAIARIAVDDVLG